VIPIGTTMTWRFIKNVSAVPATGVSGTTPAVTIPTRANTTPDHRHINTETTPTKRRRSSYDAFSSSLTTTVIS
jgi:hypothetical protein